MRLSRILSGIAVMIADFADWLSKIALHINCRGM
jgi:hypothetical protein